MPNWLNSISNWFSPPQPQSPATSGGLFQTRVTRTPGMVDQLATRKGGTYNPDTDPIRAIDARTDLTPQEKAQLKQSWQPAGPGFVTLSTQLADPTTQIRGVGQGDVLRHEQMHALYNAANLGQHAPELAAVVDPGIKQSLMESPVYQEEMRNMGVPNVLSDEGIATDLTSPGGMAQNLQNKVREYLRTNVQKKQFQQLIGLPDQSQK